MKLVERRVFFADMCLKYCQGNARKAERVFGWRRTSIELGLKEKQSGIICLGAQSICSGPVSYTHLTLPTILLV